MYFAEQPINFQYKFVLFTGRAVSNPATSVSTASTRNYGTFHGNYSTARVDYRGVRPANDPARSDYGSARLNYCPARSINNAARLDYSRNRPDYRAARAVHNPARMKNCSATCHYCLSPAVAISVTLFVASLPQSFIRARLFFIFFMEAVRGKPLLQLANKKMRQK